MDSILLALSIVIAGWKTAPILLKLVSITLVPEINSGRFEIGKANILRDDKDPQVVIIGCGPILAEALDAARDLEGLHLASIVINLHTIKPIDEQAIIHAAKITGAVVTVEEHQIMGGMGSAVAEVLARNFPVPIEFVGVHDSFGESAKDYKELWQKFGLTKEKIVESVKKVILRKNS